MSRALHLEEEAADELRLRHEHRRTHGEIDYRVVGQFAPGDAAKHVLDADDTSDVVLRLFIDGEARVRVFGIRAVEIAHG